MMAEAGYPLNLFDGSLDSKVLCNCCHLVVKNPHQCKKGHLYCKNCISHHLNTEHQQCPVPDCGCPLTTETLVFNDFADISIKLMPCKCINDGCSWRGELGELQSHVNEKCEETPIPCPIVDCGSLIKRRLKQQHDGECDHKLIPCENCAVDVKRMELPSHDMICQSKPIRCPNSGDGVATCEAMPLRGHMEAHRRVCEWEPIVCPYAEVGCRVHCLPRKDVAAHVADPATVAAVVGSLVQENTKLKARCNRQEAAMAVLTLSLEQQV